MIVVFGLFMAIKRILRPLKQLMSWRQVCVMKSPPVQYTDDEAHHMVEEFIKANRDKKVSPAKVKKSE